MSLAPSRRKWVLVLLVLLIPCIIMNFSFTPDNHEEIALQSSIAELQVKLEHLHSKYLNSREELQLLTYQLLQLTDGSHLMPDVQTYLNSTIFNISNVKFPSVYNFLPHLLSDSNSLRPAFIHSGGRSGVGMVLGIPTVKREVQSYLIPTLKNLLDRMSPSETADTLIVVMIAETDADYVSYVAKQIEVQFPNEYEAGVIDIISPHPSYYPDFKKLRNTMGDNHQRVVWRSKQNLDFAFLMSYAQSKGTFYVQLEDDILAKANFVTVMKTYALQKISLRENWIVLDFCSLGFIGKLFKCVDLPWLVQFFLMFYNDKPVDWLLDNLISTKVCSLEMDNKRCRIAKTELWLHYKPSLFQHVGTHSSLRGKVQKLKDKQFGKTTLYFGHRNPKAVVESRIKPYKHFTLARAYKGDTFFWGLLPKSGDHLQFKFVHPIFIKSYLFRSGNAEHPSDMFYNTTVEVLPEHYNSVGKSNINNVTEDGFIVIGKFDSLGIARGTISRTFGRISVLRVTVHSESDNWVILSEIHIEEDSTS
ncbi:hypothetical protein QAD02_008943 [Eretmocerus hayati]|uniref:Uncharacterized protein n=1 Tax=Eretmocerus hayati TaxID=131215 RepID=A0ACC2N897_9HYME|nr:hypothetical protein QAD02_008943 [Eretmocerus hayati]